MSKDICFNTNESRICLSRNVINTASSIPNDAGGLSTTLSLSDIRNGLSSAANTVGTFIKQNAIPIGVGLGAATAVGLGATGAAIALNNNSSNGNGLNGFSDSELLNFGNILNDSPFNTTSGNPSSIVTQNTNLQCLPRYYVQTF